MADGLNDEEEEGGQKIFNLKEKLSKTKLELSSWAIPLFTLEFLFILFWWWAHPEVLWVYSVLTLCSGITLWRLGGSYGMPEFVPGSAVYEVGILAAVFMPPFQDFYQKPPIYQGVRTIHPPKK